MVGAGWIRECGDTRMFGCLKQVGYKKVQNRTDTRMFRVVQTQEDLEKEDYKNIQSRTDIRRFREGRLEEYLEQDGYKNIRVGRIQEYQSRTIKRI